MDPLPQTLQSAELTRQPLSEQLNPKHELVLLGDAMDWPESKRSLAARFASTTGRLTLPPNLVAGLLYLPHAYDCFDEIAVNTGLREHIGSSSMARRTCKSSRRLTRRV